MNRALRLVVLSSLALAPTLAARDVIVVDPSGGPGADFDNVGPAVDAAQDGDIVLVREGDYPGWVLVDGKGISIVGDAGASVSIDDLDVRNLSVGQTAAFSNLRVFADEPTDSDTLNTLSVQDNAGVVWFQDCVITPRVSGIIAVGGAAVVENSSSVGFARCVFEAEPEGTFTFFGGGAGLFVSNSTVAIHDSELTATKGLSVGPAGLFTESSSVFLSQTVLRGGEGGDGDSSLEFCTDGHPGGPALRLGSGAPQVRLQDVTLVAGEGGSGGAGVPFGPFCLPGPTGVESVVENGAIVPFSTAPRSLEITSPVREGQMLTSTYRGVADDVVVGFWSVGADVSPIFDVLGGAFLPAFPVASINFHGIVPVTGVLQLSAQVGQFGVSGVTIYAQGVFANALEGTVLSNGVQAVLLDAGF